MTATDRDAARWASVVGECLSTLAPGTYSERTLLHHVRRHLWAAPWTIRGALLLLAEAGVIEPLVVVDRGYLSCFTITPAGRERLAGRSVPTAHVSGGDAL